MSRFGIRDQTMLIIGHPPHIYTAVVGRDQGLCHRCQVKFKGSDVNARARGIDMIDQLLFDGG